MEPPKMNLLNFEQWIHPVILQRGQTYYEQNRVSDIRSLAARRYEARVEGSESYSVEVSLDENGGVLDSRCDCPYDGGRYCKHQVAVWMVLRDQRTETDSDEMEAASPPELRTVLRRLTKDSLVDLVCRLSDETDGLEERLILQFGARTDEEKIRQARQIIRHTLRNATTRGFIQYRSARRAVEGSNQVLETAQTAYEQKQYLLAGRLALLTLGIMVKTVQFTDDSDGLLGDVIEASLKLLHMIGQATDRQEKESRELVRLQLDEASHERYDGWPDWRLTLLRNCGLLVSDPSMRARLEKQLDQMAGDADPNEWSSVYLAEQIGETRLELVDRLDGPEAASRYVREHLELPRFRERAIREALQNDNPADAIRLAEEGMQKKSRRARSDTGWEEYIYLALEKLGQKDKLREMARSFVLNGDESYLENLQALYPSDEWPSVFRDIVETLASDPYPPSWYPAMLIAEGELGKLMEFVRKNPEQLTQYAAYLFPSFSVEILVMFQSRIRSQAAQAHDRRSYRKVVALIRALYQAGATVEAVAIRDELYETYVRRPSFREELMRMKG